MTNEIYQLETETVVHKFLDSHLVNYFDDDRQKDRQEQKKRKTQHVIDATHGERIAWEDSIMMKYVPIRRKTSYFFIVVLLFVTQLFMYKISMLNRVTPKLYKADNIAYNGSLMEEQNKFSK